MLSENQTICLQDFLLQRIREHFETKLDTTVGGGGIIK